jgi:hypothetical protein
MVKTWLIDRHLRQPTSCPATSGSQSETQADDLECFCCPSIFRLETQRSKKKKKKKKKNISAAEIAADMSHFVTHIGVAEMQAETLRFS